MIIYRNTKQGFIDDVFDGILVEKIDNDMRQRFGRIAPESEVRSWSNSLLSMESVLSHSSVPNNAGIAIEYNIPYTSKRVDMIVTGKTSDNHYSAIIIELKQWKEVEAVINKDGIVKTLLNGSIRETAHPSYQAWSYASAIMDFNADIQEKSVILKPCACLHNYVEVEEDPLFDPIYDYYLKRAPVFRKHDNRKLTDFIEHYIQKGDDLETIFLIDSGHLRPSKSLQDVLSSMMSGNDEFVLLDSQKVVYEAILDAARKIGKGGKKNVIIVKGGPGTGKTILAINLLSAIINNNMAAMYVSKNSAPRNVYKKKLKGSMRSASINNLFRWPDDFYTYKPDILDVTLSDESHRLKEKSGMYSNAGENQIREIMSASKLSVFFIDDDQRVTLKDIGSVDEIKKQAKKLGLETTILELDSQFRCSGSDGYISWLDNILEIHDTANTNFEEEWEYEFEVFYDPNVMRAAIEKKNSLNNKSRIVAGYCWNWISGGKSNPLVYDIEIPEHDFRMSWNLDSSDTWAIDPNSVNEAGCIHTCQGLEFDYVGVIIGDDMTFDGNHIVTDATKRAKTDQSLKGLKTNYSVQEAKDIADKIIKNTYKVLMSRGMKGCYIYCTNSKLASHFSERSKKSIKRI